MDLGFKISHIKAGGLIVLDKNSFRCREFNIFQ